MNLAPERVAELLDLYSSVEHAWRVAGNETFVGSAELETYLDIYRESGLADPMSAELALGWLKTGNPHYIDLALCRANQSDRRGETLDALAVDVARRRMDAATRAGGPFRVRREVAKGLAFALIGIFRISADATLEEASSKAAHWLTDFDAGFGCKGSVLWREYPSRWKRQMDSPRHFSQPMSREEFAAQVIDERLGGIPTPGCRTFHEVWSEIFAAMPLASEDRAGIRY